MQKALSIVFILLFSVFVGCKKDDSSSTDPGTDPGTGPTAVPHVTFSGPNTTSTDVNAQIAKSHASSMNVYMSQSTYFSGIPAQQNGNTYTWTYGGGGMSYTFTGIKQGDGSYSWTFTFTGTSGSVNYTNFKMWEGTTSADGKNGSWTFYDFDQTGKAAELVYTTNASNVLTGTLSTYHSNGTLDMKMIIVNNPDGSGSEEIYDGTIITYKAVWIANGSGTWYTYTNGVQYQTGTWQ